MEKLCLFVILAIISTEALGMSYRNRRQAEDAEEDLEDRYGGMFPGGFFPQRPWRPNRNPNPNPIPNQNPNQDQRTTTSTTTPSTNPAVFTLTAELRQCRGRCPTTSEYNPVCGTNMQTYDNPSRLYCDQACGVNVSQLRSSRCPASIVPS
ncbi:unnamed protein product, partial [Brenthis ino]